MFKVQTRNNISSVGLDRLPKDNFSIADDVSELSRT